MTVAYSSCQSLVQTVLEQGACEWIDRGSGEPDGTAGNYILDQALEAQAGNNRSKGRTVRALAETEDAKLLACDNISDVSC